MEHQKLIDTIMDLDTNIRFATICSMVGDMQVTGQREGIENFLTPEETHKSLEYATKSWVFSRIPNHKKIGRGLYTLSVYEKLKRVTILLLDGFLLLVTIDNKGEHNKIIDKILKLVREG
jgi:hypothetical protein